MEAEKMGSWEGGKSIEIGKLRRWEKMEAEGKMGRREGMKNGRTVQGSWCMDRKEG